MKLRLKQLLSERNLTQTALADAIGSDKSHISNLISGRKQPSMEILEKIAVALDVPLVELFAESRPALEEELIEKFRRLSPEQQKAWLQLLDTMSPETESKMSPGHDHSARE